MSVKTAEAIGNLEDSNLSTQLNNELFLVNVVEGFLDKEQGWIEKLTEDSELAYIATLESGSDPSKSAEAAQMNEQYNIDSAKMQDEEGLHNKLEQRGKTALGDSTGAMSNNYKNELPVNSATTTTTHLIEKMLGK